jgi:serine/threonine protein kinase/WD40 repeat protein
MAGTGENTHEEAGVREPFFSGDSGEGAAFCGREAVGPGGQVGLFRLLGILGEGGYGIVYLAAQEHPIRRRVALKVIKPGMDSRQVIARFEAERQALALLDHPNIAHMYDAGTTPEGRPYFAMEYIEGSPITEYCDHARLTIRERLQLFLQVCSAVQHAHQKGIIHRDLKPSNILVTGKDGAARICIIDFGIAKALAQSLTEKTLRTEQGQLIGTPDYISPEQADMDAYAVDTRSDVYSLGVVLYELLTGVLPFDPDALRAGGLDHIRAIIREQEPRTPSTRLTGGGDEWTKIAQRRRTDPQVLTKSLRRELEWIPLKAMRKEPDRRYQSTSDLAEDIHNYLQELPLRAGPESVLYRMRKFIRRHRVAVAAMAAIIVLLLLGLITTHRLYISAERSREAAEAARTAEASQRRAAEQERDRVVRAEHEAQIRLADVYEQEGQRFLQTNDVDRALLFLSQAHALVPERLTVRLLLFEGLRRHEDPNLSRGLHALAWEDGGIAAEAAFAISPDRMLIAFLDTDRRLVRIYETDRGKRMARFEHPGIERLAFLPGNQYLVVRTHGGQSTDTIEVLDTAGNRIAARSRNHVEPGTIRRLAERLSQDAAQMEQAYARILISPKGDWFAFIDARIEGDDVSTQIVLWDSESRVWRIAEGEQAQRLMVGIGRLSPRAYDGLGRGRLLTLDKDGWIQRWTLPDGAFGDTFPWPMTYGRCDPTGTRFLVVEKGPSATLVTRRDNSAIRSFPGVSRLGFSPDGARLITAPSLSAITSDEGEDVCGDLWDTLDGRQIAEIAGARLMNWHFSPDGRRLVTEHADGSVQVTIPATGASVFEIPGTQKQAVADLSVDGRWLLTRGREGSKAAYLWDLEAGHSYKVFESEARVEDLTAGWLCEEIDTVFAFSHVPPDRLPRLGRNGLWVLASSGLWPCQAGADTLNDVDKLVESYVPLRLDHGVIRPASPVELLQARLNLYRSTKGPEADEAMDCLLDLADHHLQREELDSAAAALHPAISIGRSERSGLTVRRQQLLEALAGSYSARADRHRRQNRYGDAVVDYEACLRLQDTPESLNALAWLLATCPQVKDARRALAVARKGCELTTWSDCRLLATHAVASAEMGDFAEAIRLQEKALELLPAESRATSAGHLTTRLALFRSKRPYEPSLDWTFPTEDLVSWWQFDAQEGGTIFDSSGNGQQGILVTNARVLRGSRGGVLQLVGDTALACCRHHPCLDVTDALTVATWVKDERPDATKDRFLVSVWNTWRLLRHSPSNTLGFEYLELGAAKGRPITRAVGVTSIADGSWHHVAAVYDQNSVCLYVDGTPDGSVAAPGIMGTGVQGIQFGGAETPKADTTGVCLLDDVRVYHLALQADCIHALYEAGNKALTNTFSVSTGGVALCGSAGTPLKMNAVVRSNADSLAAGDVWVQWRCENGPGEVSFQPGQNVVDPYICFTEPGVYQLSMQARVGQESVVAGTQVTVYPKQFSGLVARYSFDCGDARDEAVGGLQAILVGDAGIVADPDRGLVLALDGDGDYVDCGNDLRFDMEAAITVVAWVRARASNRAWQSIVTKGDSAWRLHRNGLTDMVRLSCAGPNTKDQQDFWLGAAASIQVTDGYWHHIVGVYDGTGFSLYVDGALHAHRAASGRLATNGYPVYIGENFEQQGSYWNGWIDDVRIYNRALSTEEIAHLYEETKETPG